MVKNVGSIKNINNIYGITFKADNQVSNPVKPDSEVKNIDLNNYNNDYNVKLPQSYKKAGVTKLKNGLELHTYILGNGHKVTIVPMEGSPATVKNYVNVGSMNETDDIKGISHFLEHMAFNGTTGENGYKKLVWGDPFKLIDKLGGWTNASTNYAITDYVNSTPLLEDKDIEEQIKILAAMTEDLALPESMIEKEKSPVCSEINMIMDRPETIALDQTVRSLFNIKSSADELVAGSTTHIQNLDRDKVKEYYDKYYTPDNMNLVITGDINPDEIIKTVAKEFHSTKKSKGRKYEEKLIPIKETVRKDFISDKATDTNIVIGFEGPASNDTKSLIGMEIISAYLNTEDFGLSKELRNLNAFGGHSMEKISSNPYSPQLNMYTINVSEENSEKALNSLYKRLSDLKSPDEKTINNLKEKLLMDYKDYMEYSETVNGLIGKSVLSGNIEYVTEYENILNSITKEDIDNLINKHFNVNKAAISLVHPNTTAKELENNYNNVSFKGINRKPVETNKISETVLNNNYKLGFVDTKNDNISFNIKMKYDIPKDINPAAIDVLDYIYATGTNNISEENYNKFNQENNIDNYANVSSEYLTLGGYSDYKNFELNLNKAIELFNNPRINDEEVEKAVYKLKDMILRTQDSAVGLYLDYESQFNPRYVAKDKMLEYLEKVTKEDVIKLHQYIKENSMGYIVMNSPEGDNEIKNKAISIFNTLDNVKPFEIKTDNVYSETEKPVLLTKEKPASQADISQIYKFKYTDNPKDRAVLRIINTILSSSDSIGLFNSLRERDHLAYSVFSDLGISENCGDISLNILTTTDNKETNEISYDNVQKSINGFNRQISLLLNSAYTDEDFESAKRALKANLLNQEGVGSKLNALAQSMGKKEGIEYRNLMYNVIDSITREDIDNMAKEIFLKKPIYSIVASRDTLEANKDFLNSLII